MYLSELYSFYQRMVDSGDPRMPPPGMSEENIAFKLVISPAGELREVVSLCDSKGKPARIMVPAAVKRSSGIASNFLWDNSGYVLGVDSKGKAERVQNTFAAFKQKHVEIAQHTQNPRLLALAAFLQNWQPESFATLRDHEALLGQQMAFWVEGDDTFLHLQADVLRIWESELDSSDDPKGTCLITGEKASIPATHPAVKGVPGGQSSGGALISFNCPSFTSYGKEQNANAPVGAAAARGYVAALNYLTQRANGQCLQVGDTRVLFWAERKSPSEDLMGALLSGLGRDAPAGDGEGEAAADTASPSEVAQDAAQVEKLCSFLRALRCGQPIEPYLDEMDADTRFFMLGLAPNAARLVVRFWLADSFGALARRVARHYADCAVKTRYPRDSEFPTLHQFLLCLAAQGKTENIPSVMAGQLASAIFRGTPYPESVYHAVLQRIRAEKQVSYLRVSLMAGYLRRNHNRSTLTMALNTERTDPPYLLGRLFALLEKAQTDALGKNINSTIKDKYLSAASATPGHVFPVLLRLAKHHLSKAEYGHALNSRIATVMNSIDAFPARLTLAEQGDFFIGYYHQHNANYTKQSDPAAGQAE